MIKKKSREELLRQMIQGIVQETDITMVGKGSVTRGLASVFAGSIENIYQVLDDAVSNSFLPTASGFYLDLFGETFGLTRKYSNSARITASDRNLRVYTTSGVLSTLLPHPSDPELGRVPAGSVIRSSAGIAFTTDSNYDFPAAATEVYVGATSNSKGSSQNVGPATLSSHSLGAGVLVENLYAITTGRDVEPDEEYRYRIARWVRSAAGKNEVAIRLAVLSAGGVAGMIKEPYFAGAGSFRIIVIPTGNAVPVESMLEIYENLSSVVSEGTYFIVEPPRYLPISVAVRLVPTDGGTISAFERSNAKSSILRYLGDIRPGEELIINRLRSDILNSSNSIADVRLQSIAINGRPRALVNYKLRRDELFVPDENLTESILVV